MGALAQLSCLGSGSWAVTARAARKGAPQGANPCLRQLLLHQPWPWAAGLSEGGLGVVKTLIRQGLGLLVYNRPLSEQGLRPTGDITFFVGAGRGQACGARLTARRSIKHPLSYHLFPLRYQRRGVTGDVVHSTQSSISARISRVNARMHVQRQNHALLSSDEVASVCHSHLATLIAADHRHLLAIS